MTPEAAATVLNIEITSTVAEIQTAYRRRARLLHPDRLAGLSQADIDEATSEFGRVNQAREVLTEYATRPRETPNPGASAPPPPRQSPPPAAPQASPLTPRAPLPETRKRNFTPLIVAIAVIVVASSAGIAGAAAANHPATSTVALVDPSSDAPASTPEGIASSPADVASPPETAVTSMPDSYATAGYTDAGSGFAYKWTKPASCLSLASLQQLANGVHVSCFTMNVLQYVACTGTIQTTIDVVDANKNSIGTLDGESIGAYTGNLREYEFDVTDKKVTQAKLSSITCL